MKIENFDGFLAESESGKIQKFYMLVRQELLHTTSENPLAIMRKKTLNSLFEQVEVNLSNYKKINLSKNVPIINFCEDNFTVEKMISSGQVRKKNLYNLPEFSELISDKHHFHRLFEDCKYVPKTVFNKIDALKLKFPVIAKPAKGHSAEGIQKFDNKEQLEKTSNKFDVYSEMIDIEKEYRVFCFRNKLLNINERIKIGNDDFLKKTETKTNFFYKEIEDDKLSSTIKKLIEECLTKVKLDFYSLDFAIDKSGNPFIIEMNSRSGMGADKTIELYQEIFKDFYGKSLSLEISKKLDSTKNKWKKIYTEEKTSALNECTAVAGIIDGIPFLFKNRDRSFTPDNTIIREIRNRVEIVYYTDQTGWVEGMNEYGVGFTVTALTNKHYSGYDKSWKVTDDPKKNSVRNYSRFREKMLDILTAKTAKEAVEKLRISKKSGNFFISDGKVFYDIEVFEGDMKMRMLHFDEQNIFVKTNHGNLIANAGHQPSGDSIKRASSQIRGYQAMLQIQQADKIEDIADAMKFQAFDSSSSLNTFRTDNEEMTISQCLMDLKNLHFYFYHDDRTADNLSLKEKEISSPKIKIDLVRYTNGNKRP